jgi:UDP-glucuronate decarboxylase
MGLGAARKTVLVTGAAGFLGSHLCDRLLAEGHEVIGLDNLVTGTLDNLAEPLKSPRFHFEVGDVREKIAVFAQQIFNFACPASPVHYQADPHFTLTTSVTGAQRVIEAARGRQCVIVHASTSEIYGDPLVHPQPESYWGHVNPIGDRACYDEGKRCAETLLFDARRRWNVDARVVRIFNTYGPRMAIDDGRVVSNFVAQALEKKPLTIYGTGEQTRSFCFVSDLVDGIVSMTRPEVLDGPVNLGNPDEFTIRQLAELVTELLGWGEVVYKPLPNDDPKQRKPDITRAKQLLGYEPKVKLRQGLRALIDDFRLRLDQRANRAP